jgi:hypothetical protein
VVAALLQPSSQNSHSSHGHVQTNIPQGKSQLQVGPGIAARRSCGRHPAQSLAHNPAAAAEQGRRRRAASAHSPVSERLWAHANAGQRQRFDRCVKPRTTDQQPCVGGVMQPGSCDRDRRVQSQMPTTHEILPSAERKLATPRGKGYASLANNETELVSPLPCYRP